MKFKCRDCWEDFSPKQDMFVVWVNWGENPDLSQAVWLRIYQEGLKHANQYRIWLDREIATSIGSPELQGELKLLFPSLYTAKSSLFRRLTGDKSVILKGRLDNKITHALNLLIGAIIHTNHYQLPVVILEIEFYRDGRRIAFFFGDHGGVENLEPKQVVWLKHELITEMGVPRDWINKY